MRFARFLFALFIGAFLFIVLMKLLFFGLIAAIIIGGVSWAMRARAYHRYGSPYTYAYKYHPWQQRQSPFEGNMTEGPTPLDPRWQTGHKTTPSYSRRIEVI